ncbi:hypothetical protein HMPREF9574_00002, partial [Cutibacterium acnes HL074PA1]
IGIKSLTAMTMKLQPLTECLSLTPGLLTMGMAQQTAMRAE